MEQLNDKPKRRKSVSFCSEVLDPKSVVKCKTCGHRNVAPKIRKTFVCQKCKKLICSHCINGENSICFDCKFDEQFPQLHGELTVDDIKKINKSRVGTLFKRYCMDCELEIEEGIQCDFCQRRSKKGLL